MTNEPKQSLLHLAPVASLGTIMKCRRKFGAQVGEDHPKEVTTKRHEAAKDLQRPINFSFENHSC
jgi:hypothetical protein